MFYGQITRIGVMISFLLTCSYYFSELFQALNLEQTKFTHGSDPALFLLFYTASVETSRCFPSSKI